MAPKQDPHLQLLRQIKVCILSVLGQITHISSMKVLCIHPTLKFPLFLPQYETIDQHAFLLHPAKTVSLLFSMSWGPHPPVVQSGVI